MVRFVSFDFNGTLADARAQYDKFWNVEMIKIYAEQNGISFGEAYKRVEKEYKTVSKRSVLWHDIDYWIERLKLKTDWKKVFDRLIKEIEVFPDVVPALKKLAKKYKLIVITNANEWIVKRFLEINGLDILFDRIFSSSSHFGYGYKSKEVYISVLKELGIGAGDIVHVGDSYVFDFLVPRRWVGIDAFYLDRKGKIKKGRFVVSNLLEFAEKI